MGNKSMYALCSRFCRDVNYEEDRDDDGKPNGFIRLNEDLTDSEISILTAALFSGREECKWFIIKGPVPEGEETISAPSKTGMCKFIRGDAETRQCMTLNKEQETSRALEIALEEHGRNAIGITIEQYWAGINALAVYRARLYILKIIEEAQDAYSQRLEEAEEVGKLLEECGVQV